MKIDVELDARELHCPMPLLKLKQQLNRMQVGEVIRVFTTDSGSVKDFDTFVRQARHVMHDFVQNQQEFCFVIEKQG